MHPALKVNLADHVKLSEADFLAHEANDARKAISAVTSEMTGAVGAAVDPRPLVGKHPWLSLSAAAVAGFVGAAMVTPSRQDAAIKKLETLSKALRAAMGEKVSQVKEAGEGSDNHEKKPLGEEIVSMIFNHIVKPAVTATIVAKMKPASPEPATNGSHPAPPGPAENPPMG
jgi:hypothetical protein